MFLFSSQQCYRRETVNHTQNCAELVADYMKKSNAVIQKQYNQFKVQETTLPFTNSLVLLYCDRRNCCSHLQVTDDE